MKIPRFFEPRLYIPRWQAQVSIIFSLQISHNLIRGELKPHYDSFDIFQWDYLISLTERSILLPLGRKILLSPPSLTLSSMKCQPKKVTPLYNPITDPWPSSETVPLIIPKTFSRYFSVRNHVLNPMARVFASQNSLIYHANFHLHGMLLLPPSSFLLIVKTIH